MKDKYIVGNKITNEFVETYTKTTYRIVGNNKHSAIKPCHWLEQKLLTGRDNRNCYKGVFGIQSHRCLQNSPSMPFCNHQCVFCWRDIELGSLGGEFSVEPDEPKDLIEDMLRHHEDIIKNHLPLRRYLDNYEIMLDTLYYMLIHDTSESISSLSRNLHISKNKIDRVINLLKNQQFLTPTDESLRNYTLEPEITCCIDSREEIETLVHRELTTPDEIMQAHAESMNPNHAAISLDGEPLLYPHISALVEEFRNRNMTTFIVTNGTLHHVINNMDSLPTQLYVTLPAPNKNLYKKVCRPMIKNGWENLMETLDQLETLSCRTLVRLTAVKNLNLNEGLIEEYVKLIKNANPHFFEIKGFTLQAKALLISDRMKENKSVQYYFPDYDYLENIALKFQEIGNFPLIYTNKASRDFLFAVDWDENKDPKIKHP
jgi:wyosine [tRNA(Phe)-imidazoG37] synthetase (radical SAM superfamily)